MYSKATIDSDDIEQLSFPSNLDAIYLNSPIALDFSTTSNFQESSSGRHPGGGIKTIPLYDRSSILYIKRVNEEDEGDVFAEGFRKDLSNGLPAPSFTANTEAPAGVNQVRPFVSPVIDATSSSTNDCYSVPEGKELIVTSIIFDIRNIENYTSGPNFEIYGTGEGSLSVGELDLTAIDAHGYHIFSPAAGAKVLPAGASLRLDVETAAVADAYDINAYVFAYLRNAEV
jgi:hypothetical protein